MLRVDNSDDEETELNNQKDQHPQRAAVDDTKWKKERVVLAESSMKKTKWRGWKKSLKTENFFLDHQIGDNLRGPALTKEKDSRLRMNPPT